MKNYKVKKFFFILISVTAAIFAFSCASRPSADSKISETEETFEETENSINQEDSENQKNFFDEEDPSKIENSTEPENSLKIEDSSNSDVSLEKENFTEQNSYPDVAILKEEPQIFDETPKITSKEPEQEKLDSDITAYFESENLPQTKENNSNEIEKDAEEKFNLDETEDIFDSSTQKISDKENESKDFESEKSNSDQFLTENSKTEISTENPQNKENSASLEIQSQNTENAENSSLNDTVEIDSPILQVTENEGAAEDENISQQQEENQAGKIIISRSMTMAQNQFLEVKYPGNGWIYLGEENQQNLMRYMGRKIGTSDTVFTLRSRTEGTAVLHFYKNDALTGNFIDDYLEVKIKGKTLSKESAKAPLYEEIVPKKSELNSSEKDNLKISKSDENQKIETFTDRTNSQKTEMEVSEKNEIANSEVQNKIDSQISEENLTEDDLTKFLENAKTCLENKKFSEALENVNKFLENSISDLDEALFIKAQILESPSQIKNIKDSLNAYETIVNSYPKSKYWQEASNRATYLKRFYFNIR